MELLNIHPTNANDIVAKGIEPLADFDPIRACLATIHVSADILISSNLAAGAYLVKLSEAHKRHQGRPKDAERNELAIPWRELVTQQTGKSWEFCRRAEAVARRLLEHLRGKRSDDARRARQLLEDPQISEWDLETYQFLSHFVGACFDADNWVELMRELGVVRQPVSNPHGKTAKPKALPLPQRASLYARQIVRSIRPLNLEQHRKYLASLPAFPTGDPDDISLSEIKADLEARAAEVAEIIAAKMN